MSYVSMMLARIYVVVEFAAACLLFHNGCLSSITFTEVAL